MNKKIFLISILLFLFPCSISTAQDYDMTYFSKLPIQHEGRIKPLESFARQLKAPLHTPEEIKSIQSIRLLAESLFNPADVTSYTLFRIRNPIIKDMLNLKSTSSTFALSEIIPALQAKREILIEISEKDQNSWSKEEQQLMAIYDNALALKNVITSLHILLPLKIDLPENIQSDLNITDSELENYLVFQKHQENFQSYLKTLPPENITDQLKAFIFQITVIEQNTDPQNLVRIMPPEWPLNQSEEWHSPWQSIQQGLSGPQSAAYLKLWQEMAVAYRNGNAEKWYQSTKDAFEMVSNKSLPNFSADKLSLEVTYLSLNPYFYSLIFYVLAALLAFILIKQPSVPLILPAYMTLLAGALFHALALFMRVIILERPPVSTLYESVIFVSLICCFLALAIALFSKDKALFLMIGAICGIALYFVANTLAQDGDTLQVITAVLDTSFWLATHVVIITIGYGICLLTSLLAHAYLYIRTFRNNTLPTLYKYTFRLSLVALLFTSVGTILGGIWADQSWGRFWGWDPKENGALLIVLWLVWVIHGKIAGQLKEFGFIIGASCLGVVVALAWFGVNLLNVGLHSYGFVSGIAYGLIAFCVIEACLIAIPSYLIYRKSKP